MESSGSFFIDRSCAELAVNMCLPMITESMNDHEVCGSGFLYIVVMDPALNPANATFRDGSLPDVMGGMMNIVAWLRPWGSTHDTRTRAKTSTKSASRKILMNAPMNTATRGV